MNFLAHARLSGDDKKILLGNFIGDFIKGRQALNQFEPQVIKGVELHRAIDEFTDNHDVVRKSKSRLRPMYRHYAGVIVDVFYDHFLAVHWNSYHPEALADFASKTYQTIETFSSVLPLPFKQMLPYMIRGNWLVNYSKISGVHQALSGMASRTPYDSKMERASQDLQSHYQNFNDEFQQFFPQLVHFADEWMNYREL
ncbi:MAG TPA: ACP phosphodiesterase [Chryseosolibacter sp.]|nr:ACP phosphodiesterase [Chryseosolibacter sp.]